MFPFFLLGRLMEPKKYTYQITGNLVAFIVLILFFFLLLKILNSAFFERLFDFSHFIGNAKHKATNFAATSRNIFRKNIYSVKGKVSYYTAWCRCASFLHGYLLKKIQRIIYPKIVQCNVCYISDQDGQIINPKSLWTKGCTSVKIFTICKFEKHF